MVNIIVRHLVSSWLGLEELELVSSFSFCNSDLGVSNGKNSWWNFSSRISGVTLSGSFSNLGFSFFICETMGMID